MSYYADMGQESMVAAGPHIRAIGWLHPDHPFSTGNVPVDCLNRLKQFAAKCGESSEELRIGVSAGFHQCEFCNKSHGVGNFGVPTDDTLFIAPEMVVHYIEQHGYRPADEFISAVMRSPIPDTEEYSRVAEPFRHIHEKAQQLAEEVAILDAARWAVAQGGEMGAIYDAAIHFFGNTSEECCERIRQAMLAYSDMAVIDQPLVRFSGEADSPQRFVFHDVDWAFYDSVGEKLAERRVFVTYYKGKLEVVTVSLLHERMVALLVIMIRILAEETSLPLGSAGMTTLKRMDLDAGVEPDSSFYTTHEFQMRGRKEIDLSVDPPPDIAIEVEVTRRLGARKSIYREMGVPEIWVCSPEALSVQIQSPEGYIHVDRSVTFPTLNLEEMMEILKTGLEGDETAFAKAFRKRVQQMLTSKP